MGSTRRARQIEGRFGPGSADQLGAHLDSIRLATAECLEIASAAGRARDHSLRFVLSCHQGGNSDELRRNAFISLDALEDAVLAHRTIEDAEEVVRRADARCTMSTLH